MDVQIDLKSLNGFVSQGVLSISPTGQDARTDLSDFPNVKYVPYNATGEGFIPFAITGTSWFMDFSTDADGKTTLLPILLMPGDTQTYNLHFDKKDFTTTRNPRTGPLRDFQSIMIEMNFSAVSSGPASGGKAVTGLDNGRKPHYLFRVPLEKNGLPKLDRVNWQQQ